MKKYLFLLLLITQLFSKQGLGIQEKLGTIVPLDLKFIDEDSSRVTLKKLMNNKPTLITFNYFKCAGICTPQLNELAKVLSKVKLAENIDYKVISIDFAEHEKPSLASTKKKNIIKSMNRDYVEDAWHFVIGENNSSGKLADIVGFKYKAVPMSGGVGYIHPALTVVLSSKGKIIAYLEGMHQLPSDITMAIKQAQKGHIRETTIIRSDSPFCFTETPKADILVNKISRIAGVLSVLLFLGFFFFYLRKKKKKDLD